MQRHPMATPSPCRPRASHCAASLLGTSVQKELIPLSQEEAQQDPVLGCSIRKSFGGQLFFGHVVSIDIDRSTGERYYHVAYEDGDEEHMFASEVKPLIQPGRISVASSRFGGHLNTSTTCTPHGRVSLTSGIASTCRPSFSHSMAATPRQSGASQGQRPPRSSLKGQAPAGGHAPGQLDELGGLGGWWFSAAKVAAAMVILYVVVCILPGCFSCVGSSPSEPLEGNSFGSVSHDMFESASASWSMPSNEALMESLPAVTIPTYNAAVSIAPAAPTAAAFEQVSIPEPTPPPAASHGWEPIVTEDVTPSQRFSQPDMSIGSASGDDQRGFFEAFLDTFTARSQNADAGATAAAVMTSGEDVRRPSSSMLEDAFFGLTDAAESGLSMLVSVVLVVAGIVLMMGNVCQRRGQQDEVPAVSAGELSGIALSAQHDPYQAVDVSGTHAAACLAPYPVQLPQAPVSRVPQHVDKENHPRHYGHPNVEVGRGKPEIKFMYTSAVRKMQELGFEDSVELRNILSQYGGNVNEALREFWR